MTTAMTPSSKCYAYYHRNGVIWFSNNPQEQCAVRLVGGDYDIIRPIVEVLARHAYDGKTLLVPGIPEAGSDHEAYEAAVRFMDAVDARMVRV